MTKQGDKANFYCKRYGSGYGFMDCEKQCYTCEVIVKMQQENTQKLVSQLKDKSV